MTRSRARWLTRFYALGIGLAFTAARFPADQHDRSGGFYALGIGLAFTAGSEYVCLYGQTAVSMPSVSGWRSQTMKPCGSCSARRCFYALGIGLAFTGPGLDLATRTTSRRFYALGIGLAFTARPSVMRYGT